MRRINLNTPIVGLGEKRAVAKVLRSRQLAQGNTVLDFENAFSQLVDNYTCIAVNSGTSALHTIFMALGIGVGDEVLVPNFSFAASANAVAITGAKPVFVDVDPRTFCIDVTNLKSKIGPRTKAILAVHLYGLASDMVEIQKIAEKYNISIVEDAAQAHLASIGNKRVGTFGIAAAFSFYPTKNMTSGEGGMIVTREEEIADFARKFRNQGMIKRYENQIVGLNYRLSELHAAIGITQIGRLESWTVARQHNASYLSDLIHGYVDIPFIPDKFNHVFHQYTIKVGGNREALRLFLDQAGISSDVYYPKPLSRLIPYADSSDSQSFPTSEILSKTVLSLPIHPKLRTKDLKYIAETVQKYYEGKVR